MANMNEPFIPKSDRPEVKIDMDKSVSELTVRDLTTILATKEIYKFRKDYEKFYKEYYKEFHKEVLKEHYLDKYTEVFQGIPDPGPVEGIAQLAELVGGLNKRIDVLAEQIAEMKNSR